jgi:hypothetical protein
MEICFVYDPWYMEDVLVETTELVASDDSRQCEVVKQGDHAIVGRLSQGVRKGLEVALVMSIFLADETLDRLPLSPRAERVRKRLFHWIGRAVPDAFFDTSER